ncbi:unnamed protein product [Closterium sp. NIES-54]
MLGSKLAAWFPGVSVDSAAGLVAVPSSVCRPEAGGGVGVVPRDPLEELLSFRVAITRPWCTRRCLYFTPRLHSLQPPLIYLRRHYVAALRLSSRPPPPPSSPCSRGGEGMGVAGVGVLGSVLPFPSSSFCSHFCSCRWGGGCEGVGELGEWHWGGECETIQQPSLHLSSLPPSAAPAAVWGGGGG